jgi:hypothetical protein
MHGTELSASAEQKKREFEARRRAHYGGEFLREKMRQPFHHQDGDNDVEDEMKHVSDESE